MVDVSENLAARERLEISQAVTLGYALAKDGKGSKIKRANRQLIKKAFPEVDF